MHVAGLERVLRAHNEPNTYSAARIYVMGREYIRGHGGTLTCQLLLPEQGDSTRADDTLVEVSILVLIREAQHSRGR